MTEQDIDNMIDKAVERVVNEVKLDYVRSGDRLSPEEKTEELLRLYPRLKELDSDKIRGFLRVFDRVLDMIRGDKFFRVIELYYFENKSVKQTSELLKISQRVTGTNKSRLLGVLLENIDEVINYDINRGERDSQS